MASTLNARARVQRDVRPRLRGRRNPPGIVADMNLMSTDRDATGYNRGDPHARPLESPELEMIASVWADSG